MGKNNNTFVAAGTQPNTYILDNECSAHLKTAFGQKDITFQRVPPACHRANTADRAIQTAKAHFKAGLATLDPNFPIREWDWLIPQAEITLNLLRSSRVNPKLSACTYIFGQFDYNKTPLVPPGTKVLGHHKANKRPTFAPNGEEGWTIGPSPEHYRCLKCFFQKREASVI